MKIKALDQIHISSVKPDALRPGETFEVDDAAGAALLKSLPRHLQQVVDVAAEKAEPDHPNKAEAPPANKAAKKKRGE